MKHISYRSMEKPKSVFWWTALVTVAVVGLVLAPLFFPSAARLIPQMTVDADPENMLDARDSDRVRHRLLKDRFGLFDMIVVGVVNQNHDEGVFNVQGLSNIYDLAEFAKTIRWNNENGETEGVLAVDLLAPSTVDNIERQESGDLKFEWLMPRPPTSQVEALTIREKAQRLPLFEGTVLSKDGNALALYIPITSKSVSYKVKEMLSRRIDSYTGDEAYFITGLPVAQDTFAVEMFQQMATTAPAAMLLIFVLLYLFFRNVRLITAPLFIAMVSVIITMGALVIFGFEIHIMSSMVPIFVMPIAVLDATHILSEFYDHYPTIKDRKKTMRLVMTHLSKPMLYTTITTAIGFLSLNLTPLPPLQIFGTFVGFGVLLAWFLTITFLPAFIASMPERYFHEFGESAGLFKARSRDPLREILSYAGSKTVKRSNLILIVVLFLFTVGGCGISRIIVNDNPVKWFESSHELRKSDRMLNKMFGGTYMAYLHLKNGQNPSNYQDEVAALEKEFIGSAYAPINFLADSLDEWSQRASSKEELIELLVEEVAFRFAWAEDKVESEWEESLDYLSGIAAQGHAFKSPQVLRYMAGLQEYLQESGLVGKSNSIVEMVKTVHRELHGGSASEYRIPDQENEVVQTLFAYESSHRPHDVWHFVTPDFQEASIWLQLRSGDNMAMKKVEDLVDKYFIDNPPPFNLEHQWFGLNHINVVWQDKIVIGMLKALVGSFLVVLLVTTFLYKSILWGFLAMVPLLFSVVILYGLVGIFQIEYDAPIAILSALILGLAVDYAIHFLTRSRHLYGKQGCWKDTVSAVFGEPARAIVRNAIIIGVGFLPLLLSNLVPYQTTGIFISSILVFAGIATLIILPPLVKVFERRLFINTK